MFLLICFTVLTTFQWTSQNIQVHNFISMCNAIFLLCFFQMEDYFRAGESWWSTCLQTFRWIAWCRVYQKQDLNHTRLKRVSLFFGGDQSSTSSSKSNFLFAFHSFIPRVLSVSPLRVGFSLENRPFSSRNAVCSSASVAPFQTFQLFSVFHCTKNSKRSLRSEKVHRDHSATSFAYDHDPLPSLLSGR